MNEPSLSSPASTQTDEEISQRCVDEIDRMSGHWGGGKSLTRGEAKIKTKELVLAALSIKAKTSLPSSGVAKKWTYRKAKQVPPIRGDALFGFEIVDIDPGIPAIWFEFESTARVICDAHKAAIDQVEQRAQEWEERYSGARSELTGLHNELASAKAILQIAALSNRCFHRNEVHDQAKRFLKGKEISFVPLVVVTNLRSELASAKERAEEAERKLAAYENRKPSVQKGD